MYSTLWLLHYTEDPEPTGRPKEYIVLIPGDEAFSTEDFRESGFRAEIPIEIEAVNTSPLPVTLPTRVILSEEF